jgi:hypothetical protein
MPSITATAASNFGSYTLYLDWSENIQPASNTSTINWNAYLRKNSSGDTSFNLNATTRFYVEINGTIVSDFMGGYDFRSPNNFAGATRGMGSGTTNPIGHASDGSGAVSARILMSGPGPISGGDSGYQTIGLTNFDRSAYTPYYTDITRTSATNFYVAFARTGSVNGPTTYVLERATNAAMTENYTTFSEGNQTVNANTTYYFRMYAYGDEGGNKYSGVYGPYYGQPGQPSIGTPTRTTTAQKRISVPFSGPSYVGSGITSYTIVRSGTPSKTITNVSSSPFIDADENLIAGNSYTYTVSALSSGYTSVASASSASIVAPGIPYAPTAPPTFTVNGLDITVTSPAVSSDGGTAINSANANEGYFVQYQTAPTQNGTYGFGGINGAWSTPVKMSDQTNRVHTYSSLTPAIFYKFRVYAANSITLSSNNSTQLYYPHNNSTYTANFATTTTGYFLAAGGRRWTGSEWVPTATAKRWNGTEWVAFTTAKRWDGSNWVNLS